MKKHYSAWLATFASPNGREFRNVFAVMAATAADAEAEAWLQRQDRGKPCKGWSLQGVVYLGKARELRPGQLAIFAESADVHRLLQGVDLGRTVVVTPDNHKGKRLPAAQVLAEQHKPSKPPPPKPAADPEPLPRRKAGKRRAAEPERALVFSFGSNLYHPQLQARCPGVARVDAATLEGWALGWAGHSQRWGGPVATIQPRRGSVVQGAVVALGEADLAALDAAEGEGVVYQRMPVQVRLQSGETVDAWTYIHREQPDPQDEPSPRYAARIAAGLTGWGWGLETLDQALQPGASVQLGLRLH